MEFEDNGMEFEDNGAYVDIDKDESTLDGHFTSQELRQIADAMDKLKTIQ